jgi:hypothetical protein
MHSTKYIAILALLGVGAVLSKQNRRSLAQLKALSNQERCASSVPTYREPTHTRSWAPTSHQIEVTPSYVEDWSAFYEEPAVPLYTYQEVTESYVPAREPSPVESYFYWNEETTSYRPYEPTPAVWTEYFETPAVSLYWQEPSTETYHEIAEPSPFVSYSYWDVQTESYRPYEPTTVQWTEFYEQPETDLYWYDVATNTYVQEEEPSPVVDYFTFSESTGRYTGYEPTPVQWTAWYEPATVDLYTFVGGNTWTPSVEDVPAGTSIDDWFTYVAEPSPYQSYYGWNLPTQTYEPYVPTPVAWTDWYEPATEEVYTFVPALDTYVVVDEPSPYVSYWSYVPETEQYVEYEPTPAVWTYAVPTESLFWYDVATNSYIEEEEEPSPYVNYFTYSPKIDSYVSYHPEPIEEEVAQSNCHTGLPSFHEATPEYETLFSARFEEPSVPLY